MRRRDELALLVAERGVVFLRGQDDWTIDQQLELGRTGDLFTCTLLLVFLLVAIWTRSTLSTLTRHRILTRKSTVVRPALSFGLVAFGC